jgi:Flp pilus assembly protein TadD
MHMAFRSDWMWQRRGQTRSAVGDVSGAISDLNKALELEPQDVDIYCQRGGYKRFGVHE